MNITKIVLNNIPNYTDGSSIRLETDEENVIKLLGSFDTKMTLTTSYWKTIDDNTFRQLNVQAIPEEQAQAIVTTYPNAQLGLATMAESISITLESGHEIECKASNITAEDNGNFIRYTIDLTVIDIDGDNVIDYVKHDYVKGAYNLDRLQKLSIIPETIFYAHSFEASPDLDESANIYKVIAPNTMQKERASGYVSLYLPKNEMTGFIYDSTGGYKVSVESSNKNNNFDTFELKPKAEHSDSYEFQLSIDSSPVMFYSHGIYSSNIQVYTENKRGVGSSEYQYVIEYYTKILPKILSPDPIKDTVVSDGITYNDSVTQYNEAQFRLYLSESDYVMLSNYMSQVKDWTSVSFGGYTAVNEVRIERDEAASAIDLIQLNVFVPFSIYNI